MVRILIVHAHPEPRSFCSALRDLAVEALSGAGHEVRQSDLYAMRFDAAGGPADFLERADPAVFRYQREQKQAAATGGFTEVLRAEIETVRWAEVLLLNFPLWWFSLPAILKGWVDRVFAMGVAYDIGQSYDAGPLRGRRAMLTLTTGSPAPLYAPEGLNGDIDGLLFHIQHGMLAFVGMEVLPPFIAHGAARASDADRVAWLAAYRARLLALGETTPLRFDTVRQRSTAR